MKVYQLIISDLNLILDPVFNTREAANLYKKRYINRKLVIRETYINNKKKYVYRIETIDEDGVYLENNLFSNYHEALNNINSNQRIVKENIIGIDNFKYTIREVA
jgi:hypothetical protein